jgi:hypothetical protein
MNPEEFPHMLSRFLSCAALVGAVLLAGCATPTKMAFGDDREAASATAKPVMLMTVNFKNKYRPDYQPKLIVVHVERPGATEAKDRINFTMDDKARMETGNAEAGNTYLLRMELPPGKYQIVGMSSRSGIFPFTGAFFAPLHVPLEVTGNGIFYLGHVNAVVRERQGNEFRAGPPIPLLDQAVIGASGGTFDIEIVDAQASDESLFRERFPVLKSASIQKAVLPAFDRARAQKWWEEH